MSTMIPAPKLSKLDRAVLARRREGKPFTRAIALAIREKFCEECPSTGEHPVYGAGTMRGTAMVGLCQVKMSTAGAPIVGARVAYEKRESSLSLICSDRDWCEFVYWAYNTWMLAGKRAKLTAMEICEIFWLLGPDTFRTDL